MYVASDLSAKAIAPPTSIVHEASKPLKALPVFIANFFFSLHFATTLYINSSFLGGFFPSHIVGFLYVLGAIGNIFFYLNASRMLWWLGSRGFLFLFLFLTMGSVLGIAYSGTAISAAIFFLIYASVSLMVYYAFDLMLEELSLDTKTGEIRGLYLTIANLAIMGGPILVTVIGAGNNFSSLYFTSAIVLVPILLMTMFSLKMRTTVERHVKIPLPWPIWRETTNVRSVTLARTVLEFFYAVMVIYMPIHLHQIIGFDWREIGIIFTVMLLPFVLFEWPAGELADRRYGEKEMMSIGFIILSLSVLVMPFLGKSFGLWILILFLSRVGASLIEIMTESYFFKQVGVNSVGLISIFRLSRPTGLIAGSAIGMLSLAFLPQGAVFFLITIIALLSLKEVSNILDTK